MNTASFPALAASLLFLAMLYFLHRQGINLLPGPCMFCELRNWVVRRLFAYIRTKIATNPALANKLMAAMGDPAAQFVDGALDPSSPYRGDDTPVAHAIISQQEQWPPPLLTGQLLTLSIGFPDFNTLPDWMPALVFRVETVVRECVRSEMPGGHEARFDAHVTYCGPAAFPTVVPPVIPRKEPS